MSGPSSSFPIHTPDKINVSPETSSDEVEESTDSDDSTSEEDEGEFARHKSTPIAEEVTIPPEFPARHLWSPFSLSSCASFHALGASPADHIIVPPIVLAQAHDALSNALSSPSQLSSVTPRPASKKPLPEPIVTLFCPFDHTARVIDTAVRRVALNVRADVLVLDSLMFAQGKDTTLGPDFEKFLDVLFGIGEQDDNGFKSRQVQRYLRAVIDVELPISTSMGATTRATAAELRQEPATSINGNAPTATDNLGIERPPSPTNSVNKNSESAKKPKGRPRPRIIYLKDFGAIASHARSFLRELIITVRSRRTALQSSVDSDKPFDPCKIQPTVIVLGVSQSLELPSRTCCKDRIWSAFVDGFKKSNHENMCTLCPEINQTHVLSDTESITNVLGDLLCATPNRVTYANTTSDGDDPDMVPSEVDKIRSIFSFIDPPVKPKKCDRCERKPDRNRSRKREVIDPDMGHEAIYCRIVGVHGFIDSRDPSVEADRGGRKPDQNLWSKGEAMAQKERKDELAPLRAAREERFLAANENVLCKTLAARGAILPEGVGIFSALPEDNLSTNGTTGSNRLKKTEKLEADKYATLSGLKSDELPQALANHLATLVLYTLSSSKPSTRGPEVSRNPFGRSASPLPLPPPTEMEERAVTPEDIAVAIGANASGYHQLDQWLDDYKEVASNESGTGKEKNKEDPVVAKVRSSDDLNRHEKRLLERVVDTTQLDTRFEDVCIEPKTIEDVRTIISLPLMCPAAFATGILHKEALSGILLYGPPGTGKTMLCRAVAKECNVRMLLIAPSDIEDMWAGESEKLIAATFSLARKIAPCAIFIDEVDAVFGARTSDCGTSSRYHRSMLTQFMQEMDGLNSAAVNKKNRIVVIGATNRPFDLDDAILRRLPRRMLVSLPGLKEREEILKVHLRDDTLEDVDLSELARRTNNYSGSDLKNLAVYAALESLKDILPQTTKKKRASKGDSSQTENSTLSVGMQDGEDDEDKEGVDDGKEEDTFDLPPRVIRRAHFNAALEQVTATSSRDMASVRELHRWSAKFSRNSSALHPDSTTARREHASVSPTGSTRVVADSPSHGMRPVDPLPFIRAEPFNSITRKW